jgi:arginine decarboxylase
MFVTPYPPGFPILVPGQVMSANILAFMQALDTREIHGYWPDFGYRVFTDAALAPRESPAPSAHDNTPDSGVGARQRRGGSRQKAEGVR